MRSRWADDKQGCCHTLRDAHCSLQAAGRAPTLLLLAAAARSGKRVVLPAACPLTAPPLTTAMPRRPSSRARLQVIVAERGPLVFVFNFSPFNTYEGLQVRS